MTISESLRRRIFALFALVFLAHSAASIYWGMAYNVALAALAIPPVVLYFCRVSWSRYLVGGFAIVVLLIHFSLPAVAHEIERTPLFWFFWWLLLPIFAFTPVVAFVPTVEE